MQQNRTDRPAVIYFNDQLNCAAVYKYCFKIRFIDYLYSEQRLCIAQLVAGSRTRIMPDRLF